MGPTALEPGDEVWLLEGGMTPFILRRRPGSECYRMIGEAYVHGIMHGEAMMADVVGRVGPVTIL